MHDALVLSVPCVPEFDKGGCGMFGLVAHEFVMGKKRGAH